MSLLTSSYTVQNYQTFKLNTKPKNLHQLHSVRQTISTGLQQTQIEVKQPLHCLSRECSLSDAGELGLSMGSERKPKPFSGLLSSLQLSYGESNKPQRGCRGHPLHNALAPPTRHWVPDCRFLSQTRRQRGHIGPELWL